MKIALSLKTKIRIVFVFLFILLILSFLPTFFIEAKKDFEKVTTNYERITHYIRKERLSREEVIKYMQNLKFTKVKNHQEVFKSIDFPILKRHGFEALKKDDRYYIHILAPHFRILFLDETRKFKQSYINYFVLIFISLLFIFIYYLIMKNINSNERQLKSRQLFLRAVMHELKTPISKGRIVSELIEDEKQKNRIITVFKKLNLLIDNFAKVEQIVSKNYNLNMHTYNIATAIDKSIELLMLENTDNITLENISTNKINIDLDLFALAVKNLIDNALKYSNDTKVIIKEEENQLLFISNADALKKPLEEYYKPFHNDARHKNHGMGLGLYIVNSIVQMHNMKLQYEYKNEQNVFKIVLKD